MRLNLGLVEFGDGPVKWHLGLADVVDGKPRWKIGKKFVRTQANGSTRILWGLLKTKSDAQRKAAKAAKQKRKDDETKALLDFAKQAAADDRKATNAQARTDRATRQAEAQATTWGAQGAGRQARTCGQPTDDGTPCQRPIKDATGCGVSHSKAVAAMKARTRTASRGTQQPRKSTSKATSKTARGRK
jgi:hypothetical protein